MNSKKIEIDNFKVILGQSDFQKRELEVVSVERIAHENENVQKIIEEEWSKYGQMQKKIGKHGHLTITPLFRFEGYKKKDKKIVILLSQTDYKEVYGTNIKHPEIKEIYGDEYMGNALGICSIVKTSDNQIVLFKRSNEVLELPGYYHMCAGHFERSKITIEKDLDIFSSIEQEIEEELSLNTNLISFLKPIGLCRSLISYKPELLFYSEIHLQSTEINKDRLNFEHKEVYCIKEEEFFYFVAKNWSKIVPAAKAAIFIYKTF